MPDIAFSHGIGLKTDSEQLETAYQAYKALLAKGFKFGALSLLGLAARLALVGDERAREVVSMARSRAFGSQPQAIEALSMVILGELERSKRWSHEP